MNVVEIFNSIEGEGKRTGLPCTFIRLFGCNLHCDYCDSQYACVPQDLGISTMSVNEILEVVKSFGCPNVTVTGGEPLIHDGIEKLLHALLREGYWVNVETNGTMVPPIRSGSSRDSLGSLFYTMDFKTFSSGMQDKMNPEAFKNLDILDVLKFVVGSTADLDQALSVYEKYSSSYEVYISPVFGKIEPVEIVEYVKCHKLWNWHVQVQLHKIIWDPSMKGV